MKRKLGSVAKAPKLFAKSQGNVRYESEIGSDYGLEVIFPSRVELDDDETWLEINHDNTGSLEIEVSNLDTLIAILQDIKANL